MSEYRGKSDEQLVLDLRDLERHLFQLRFQSATDRLETPSEIRKARREIARIKTLQRQRDLEKEAKQAASKPAPAVAASVGAATAAKAAKPKGTK
jgi:large subunit ribosomal protein L29